MMQKIQMGGGAISPAVLQHVRKSVMQVSTPEIKSKQVSSIQVGGGVINPALKKHISLSTKAAMGGGAIHPNIAKHILSN